uniref:Claudin n=1 Tax=Gasterosteus aculeatus aculeatus TaxID=481459 RepID=A0AAQ4R153_GASAC
MLSTALQILAFALALLGVIGATVATLLPNWKVSVNVWGGVMTPMSRMQGLWVDCVWFSSGVFSCTVKSSLLSLPPCLQARGPPWCSAACWRPSASAWPPWASSAPAGGAAAGPKGHTAICSRGLLRPGQRPGPRPGVLVHQRGDRRLPGHGRQQVPAGGGSVRDLPLCRLPAGSGGHLLSVLSRKEDGTDRTPVPRRYPAACGAPRGPAVAGAAPEEDHVEHEGPAAETSGTRAALEGLHVSLQTPPQRPEGQLQPAGVRLVLTGGGKNNEKKIKSCLKS